jgi:hypothetical protein
MNRACVAAVLLLGSAGAASADDRVLESRTLHLGRPGQFEWEAFKDRAVDAELLELRFEAKTNATEQTLRIWQRDVKLSWPVLLNGRRLGTLTTAETPLECILPVPPAALKDGGNVLTILAASGLDDIEAGPVILDARPPGEVIGGAAVKVAVTDADGGAELPCRITLTRKDGTLQPLRAEPASETATRTGVVYTHRGRAEIHVPPGSYVLHAGRGFEWGVARADITLAPGEAREVRLELTREVATPGWVAADSHIHTLTHSGHGDAKIEERMLTIAGEGIELAVATDHNHHTDYAPAAASAGVADRFTPVIGNEVTTKHGHFNAFPVAVGAKVVDFSEQDWAKLIPAIRATPGVEVITLNHPRDVHSGFIPLGGVQFNPSTGRHRQAAALKIDAMEVVTSAAMQSDIHLLFRDWFALLNRGHRIAAVASSDSHDVNRFILGQGRTYVAANDENPARLNLDEIWRSYHEGRLLVSLGLVTTIRVNGRFGVGDLASGLGSEIELEVTVSGPSWVKADRLELFANGILIREQGIDDAGRAGAKARVTWKLPKPAHDVHWVAIATGPGVTEPFWEIPRPYQASSKVFTPRVIGATNPVWIDGDDDGRFESAFAIAQELVVRFGNDLIKLRETLARHDAAVGIQVESIAGDAAQKQPAKVR